MPEKLTRLSAVELARLVRTKRPKPGRSVEAHLAAIARINPAVTPFAPVAAEKALAWAREAERAVKEAREAQPSRVPVRDQRTSRSRRTIRTTSARRCSGIMCPPKTESSAG